MMSPELSPYIGNLLAVVVGFLLAQVSEYLKRRKVEKATKASVRRLIRLEINSNIENLVKLNEAIQDYRGEWLNKEGEFQIVRYAQTVSRMPIPYLSSRAWEANLASVANAYSEEELQRIWEFHHDVERLVVLHKFFLQARDERKESKSRLNANKGFVGDVISGIEFSENVRSHAPEYKKILEEIVEYQADV
jgi:hypothetical protein